MGNGNGVATDSRSPDRQKRATARTDADDGSILEEKKEWRGCCWSPKKAVLNVSLSEMVGARNKGRDILRDHIWVCF
jgi:hypothetical protein